MRTCFFGTNVGLAMMLAFSLFPGGIAQVWDVVQHGYWHARGLEFTSGTLARTLEWMRLPGDLVFIVFGSVPLLLAGIKGWRLMREQPVEERPAP